MKGTLRKTNEGIVFTIDEDMINCKCYDTIQNKIVDSIFYNKREYYCHKILASTFGVGLELWVKDKDFGNDNCIEVLNNYEFNTEYPYTIQDNKVIIEL
jgi:hypothetical protein